MSESKFKTMRHIETVRNYLACCTQELVKRSVEHDQSKLETPEVELYETATPKLRGLTYGSEEYKACLREIRPAIDHHYAHNRHHAEYHPNGIKDMNLIDILEMLCDWKAATLRHGDGDIYKSIEINKTRYGYSDDFAQLLFNTAKWIDSQNVYHKADQS